MRRPGEHVVRKTVMTRWTGKLKNMGRKVLEGIKTCDKKKRRTEEHVRRRTGKQANM
jgi:hypothetical protein